ncbi:hypothetical protein METP3_02799 [Methanosarcinales archaeon]|nr:hypothetical protein METP3_02799 [Methanosarcinales archaeon]
MKFDCQKLAPMAREFYLFLKLQQKFGKILIFGLYHRYWQKFALNLTFPNCDALSHELTRTHYRLLQRIEKEDARRG